MEILNGMKSAMMATWLMVTDAIIGACFKSVETQKLISLRNAMMGMMSQRMVVTLIA